MGVAEVLAGRADATLAHVGDRASMARYAAFDFGAVARYTTASASGMRPSGMPMNCTASAAATASGSAVRVGHADVLGDARR